MLTEDQALKRSMEVFRIDEVVWDLVPKFKRTFAVPLKIELQVDEPHYFNFRGNRMLVALSISNLIENALKYANGQEVLVRMSTLDERLSLEIIDQGIGIPRAELEAVKQTFYRGSNVGTVKGSGIGLSFAQIVFKDQGWTLLFVPMTWEQPYRCCFQNSNHFLISSNQTLIYLKVACNPCLLVLWKYKIEWEKYALH
ncbi:sensor histidine kinase [Sphingobacterium sp. E70]|uniref:sensor histidine kinase n=1 Tax=Sphingobacterium sp. E70 TaxID=2853439 RepID=UPI00211C583E|nr:sensor histidine kinase [Sphingobacterium sp. E70]ULT26787.1 sensor histidine kinase [Sphingobacterium sp. E70]